MANSVSKEASITRRTNRFLFVLLIPIALIFLFTPERSLYSSQLLAFRYPTNQISSISIFAIFCLLLLGLITQKKRIFIDPVLWTLFLRIPLLLIPLFYTVELNGYLGNYVTVLICPLVYMVSRSLEVDVRRVIIAISLISGLILSAQVILNAWNVVGAMGIQGYTKTRIVVPAGKSNTLASFFLFFFFSLLYSLPKGWKKSLVLLILLIGLLLTRSDGGILAFIFVVFMGLLLPDKLRIVKISGFGALVIMVVLGGIVFGLYSMGFLDSYIRTFQTIGHDSINVTTSGRIVLFAYSFQKFLRYPLFGNGLGFPAVSMIKYDTFRPHNLILESLTQGGFANLIVFVLAVFIPIRKLSAYARSDSTLAGILMASIALLLHGMAEPNLFSYYFDLFFWLYLGLGMTRAKKLSVSQGFLPIEETQ